MIQKYTPYLARACAKTIQRLILAVKAAKCLPVLFSIIFILPSWLCSYAENQGIGLTLVNFTLDSTHSINLGYVITINANVTNYDTTSYTGPLNFGLRNNHGIITNQDIFSKPPYSGNNISLGGKETVPAIFSVTVSPEYFAPGPDVVVIWPITSRPIADSVVIPVDIVDPNGINNEKDDPLGITITNNLIALKNVSNGNSFKQVRIFNLIGQDLYRLNANYITQIPIPDLPKGIYLCELTAADGTRRIIRFFHTPSP